FIDSVSSILNSSSSSATILTLENCDQERPLPASAGKNGKIPAQGADKLPSWRKPATASGSAGWLSLKVMCGRANSSSSKSMSCSSAITSENSVPFCTTQVITVFSDDVLPRRFIAKELPRHPRTCSVRVVAPRSSDSTHPAFIISPSNSSSTNLPKANHKFKPSTFISTTSHGQFC